MHLKMFWILIACLGLSGMPLDIFSCVATVPEKIKAGDVFDLSVTCNVQTSWYIYAPNGRNKSQGMTETSIRYELPKGFQTADKTKFPSSTGHGRFQVYQGSNIRMIQSIRTESSVKPGKYSIRIKIRYQTCNDQICLAPGFKEMKLEISVR